MRATSFSQVLADDLLLDRIGARLDTDDELGSLLLSLAHHVDAPVSRPSVRARRRRNHRALTVFAALGIAVSGATVAAAIESAPDAPATAGGTAHTRFLPQALQALGLPFAGPGLAPGRLLLPPVPLADGSRPFTLTSTGLPAALLLDDRGSAMASAGTASAGSASEGDQQRRGTSEASGALGAMASSPGSSGSHAVGSTAPSTGSTTGSTTAANPASTTAGDDGGREASGAPQNGSTKTSGEKSQGGGSTPESTGSTQTPASSPTSSPTKGNGFAGTDNAGQGAGHAATPATPASPGTPASPATPAGRSATTPPAQGGGNPNGENGANEAKETKEVQEANGAAKGREADPTTPAVPTPETTAVTTPTTTVETTPDDTAAASTTPTGP